MHGWSSGQRHPQAEGQRPAEPGFGGSGFTTGSDTLTHTDS
jgi:hypothetical protein